MIYSFLNLYVFKFTQNVIDNDGGGSMLMMMNYIFTSFPVPHFNNDSKCIFKYLFKIKIVHFFYFFCRQPDYTRK